MHAKKGKEVDDEVLQGRYMSSPLVPCTCYEDDTGTRAHHCSARRSDLLDLKNFISPDLMYRTAKQFT